MALVCSKCSFNIKRILFCTNRDQQERSEIIQKIYIFVAAIVVIQYLV